MTRHRRSTIYLLQRYGSKLPLPPLPSELWGLITSYLDARDIGKLLIAVNKNTRACLIHGVTHLADTSDTFYSRNFAYLPLREIPSKFISMFSNLVHLHLPYNENLNDLDWMNWVHLPLHYIDLSCNENITDFAIQHSPPMLKHLSLSFNINITDSGISYLPTNLTYLDLDRAKSLTDLAIPQLPRTLQTLNLTFASQITDDGLKHLPVNLTRLQLAKNNNITDGGLKFLPETLNILDVSFNRQITPEGVEQLLSRQFKVLLV